MRTEHTTNDILANHRERLHPAIKAREAQARVAIRQFQAKYFRNLSDRVHLWQAEADRVFLEVYWQSGHQRIWIDYDGNVTARS